MPEIKIDKSNVFLGDFCDYVGVKVLEKIRLSGGSNNAVYKLVTDKGDFLLKEYFKDERNRLEREFGFVEVLRGLGIGHVPEPIFKDSEANTAVYEFVEGMSLEAEDLEINHIEQIVEFLLKLHSFSYDQVKTELPMAFMSALSFNEVLGHMDNRDHQFGDGLEAVDPKVKSYLEENKVMGLLEEGLSAIKTSIGDQKMKKRIGKEYWRLSPTDFGPHNMIWRPDGELVVIDLEYAGWDHPMRFMADFLEHERLLSLKPELRKLLVNSYLEKTTLPKEVTDDLWGFMEIAKIEWVKIIVSSLLPDKIARIEHSKGDFDKDAYIDKQLDKLKRRLGEIKK